MEDASGRRPLVVCSRLSVVTNLDAHVVAVDRVTYSYLQTSTKGEQGAARAVQRREGGDGGWHSGRWVAFWTVGGILDGGWHSESDGEGWQACCARVLMECLPAREWHREGLVHRVREALRVVRVDEERAVIEVVGGAGKLG